MRTLNDWLDRYGESHRHPVNENVHRVCVPVITLCVLALLWALSPWAALALVAGAGAWYLRLSRPLALGMLALSAAMLAAAAVLPVPMALALFVGAWVGQIWGHHVEGRKPSFLEDLQFLLVGPLWLLADVYRRRGWPV